MSPEALAYIVAAGTVVAALAIVMQAIMMVAVHKSTKAAKEQITIISGHVESLAEAAQKTLEQSRKQLSDVTGKANEVLSLTRTQLVRIDEVMNEATARAKVQMDRLELVLDDTISRLHETTAAIHSGVMRPLREINGVAAGLRAGLEYLLRGRRATVEQATHDEEMFI